MEEGSPNPTEIGPGPGSFSLPGNCVDPCNARMGARIYVLFIKELDWDLQQVL